MVLHKIILFKSYVWNLIKTILKGKPKWSTERTHCLPGLIMIQLNLQYLNNTENESIWRKHPRNQLSGWIHQNM